MQRRMRCRGKLKLTVTAGTLIESWPRTPSSHVAACDRYRPFITAGRTNPSVRPDHCFEQAPALLLIAERRDHIVDGLNSRKHRANRFRHRNSSSRNSPSESHDHIDSTRLRCVWFIKAMSQKGGKRSFVKIQL